MSWSTWVALLPLVSVLSMSVSNRLSTSPLLCPSEMLLCGTGVKVLVLEKQPLTPQGDSHRRDAQSYIGKRSCCRVTAFLN